jgi:ABC-type transport system involved in cytochrome bd biosynthesis fused ATPase/permease subunit
LTAVVACWACAAVAHVPALPERGGGQDKVTSIQNQSLSMSQPPSDAIVAVEHVFKSVTDSTGTLDILQDIHFTLGARETAAIVGASGSGKSTLLSIIAGLDTPTRGTVKLAGDDLFAIDEDERAALRAQRVGFVFQSFQLLGNLSALENVMLPLELANRKDARKAATEMLGRVGLGSAWATTRRCCRAASSSAWRWPGPSWCSRPCCWPTSPPAAWTSPPASRS